MINKLELIAQRDNYFGKALLKSRMWENYKYGSVRAFRTLIIKD